LQIKREDELFDFICSFYYTNKLQLQ